MGLHVGAIFILIFISLLGSLTPLILSKLHRKDGGIRIPIFVFQFGRVFGGGTILGKFYSFHSFHFLFKFNISLN